MVNKRKPYKTYTREFKIEALRLTIKGSDSLIMDDVGAKIIIRNPLISRERNHASVATFFHTRPTSTRDPAG